MNRYLDCWVRVATDLFHQALAGEPDFVDAQPGPRDAGSFGFVVTLSGDEAGRFNVLLDASILEAPLLGDGIEQKQSWAELLRETFEAACGELLTRTGKKCRVGTLEECETVGNFTRAFRIQSAGRSWGVTVLDQTREEEPEPVEEAETVATSAEQVATRLNSGLSPRFELLLDVELEASLRFGCREMPLGEILDLGPGDVVQLDRDVDNPVDLIVGDKIVARGEVILVNGNFGLRISEVAAPRKRLESIRCLF
jgi:flagellar motor switch protein FliN